MTGIANKAGKTGCNHCCDPKHWMENCPNRHPTGAELGALRKKDVAVSQLLHVGEGTGKGGESDDDPSLGNLEGVALVSPAVGIVVQMRKRKLYLDSCASHIQTFLEMWQEITYETQIGLHTISNGGQNTASKSGMLLGGIEAWLVRSWVANLLSISELERRGFRIQSDTFGERVVTSPGGGAQLGFERQRDTGRCDRFPFVYLDNPKVPEFFDVVREELRVESLSTFQSRNLIDRIITPTYHGQRGAYVSLWKSRNSPAVRGAEFRG